MNDPRSPGSASASVVSGLVVVDKPAGPTSQRVAGRIRKLAGTRRVGHAGTLDPMATGVLIIGVGRATRLLGHLTLTDKSYEATIRLGATTVTDDHEGDVLATVDAFDVTEARVREAMAEVTGPIDQVPSRVSAIKVDGERAHRLVRRGEQPDLPARAVTVYELTLVELTRDRGFLDVRVRATVSSGTYIRALARDIGDRLGVGGHLTALRRTQVGPYDLSLARTLDELEENFVVLPLGQAAAGVFPRLDVDAGTATRVGHGARLPATGVADGPVAVYGPDDELLALVQDDGTRARYLAVFVG